MSTITREEIEKRIEETEKILQDKLRIDLLTTDQLSDFYANFITYLSHSSNKELLGRRPKELSENIDKYKEFCKRVGLTEIEIIESIKNFPSILHTFDDEFVDKFVILSVVENKENTLRKEKLIKNPRAYTIDIKTIFARYQLMQKLKYPITWSNLVKATNNEFASIFVKDKYDKPYKIFDNINEVSSDRLKEMFPLDYIVINDLRKSEKNKFLFEGILYGKSK